MVFLKNKSLYFSALINLVLVFVPGTAPEKGARCLQERNVLTQDIHLKDFLAIAQCLLIEEAFSEGGNLSITLEKPEGEC